MLEPFRRIDFGLLKQSVKSFLDDDGMGLGAEMAYHFLLALFPFLLFLAALASFVGQLVGVNNLFRLIMSELQSQLPPQATDLVGQVVRQVLEQGAPGLLSFGILATLWAASGGTATLMKAMNRAYEVAEGRSIWKHRLLAVAMAVGLALIMILALIVYVFGFQIGMLVANQLGLGTAFITAWNLARWPLIGLFLMLILAVNYYLAPDVKQQFDWVLPGAVLATLLWFVVTAGFSFYVRNFGSFGETYGSIGAVIVLMVWMYLVGMVVVAGGELNAELNKRHNPATKQDVKRKHAQQKKRDEEQDGEEQTGPSGRAA